MKPNDPDAPDMTREKLRELQRQGRDAGGGVGRSHAVQGFALAPYRCLHCGMLNRCVLETQANTTIAHCSRCNCDRTQERVR